jgi:hypothetical protein
MELRATSYTRLKALDHGNVELSLVEKAETVQVHFTLGGEGLKAQKKVHGWKVYMESYMADNG